MNLNIIRQFKVLISIEEVYNQHPEFEKENLIERLCIPIEYTNFRVTWVDDQGKTHTNMGYRIQHNNAIGPYKGGIRFHASVNLSILKFLAFEQTFKNSLTTLPMGGAKEDQTSLSGEIQWGSHAIYSIFYVRALEVRRSRHRYSSG